MSQCLVVWQRHLKKYKILEERFGQPFQVVTACVESLTKGPAIQVDDKESLQRYADTAQVTYDTLDSTGYLSKMNTDNPAGECHRAATQVDTS